MNLKEENEIIIWTKSTENDSLQLMTQLKKKTYYSLAYEILFSCDAQKNSTTVCFLKRRILSNDFFSIRY